MRKVTNRRRRSVRTDRGPREHLTVTFVAVADQKKFWSHSPTVQYQANETVEVRGIIRSHPRTLPLKRLTTGRKSRLRASVTAFVFIERREATSHQSQTRTVRYALYVHGKAYSLPSETGNFSLFFCGRYSRLVLAARVQSKLKRHGLSTRAVLYQYTMSPCRHFRHAHAFVHQKK